MRGGHGKRPDTPVNVDSDGELEPTETEKEAARAAAASARGGRARALVLHAPRLQPRPAAGPAAALRSTDTNGECRSSPGLTAEKAAWLQQEEAECAELQRQAEWRSAAAAAAKRVAAEACAFVRASIASEWREAYTAAAEAEKEAARRSRREAAITKAAVRRAETEALKLNREARSLARGLVKGVVQQALTEAARYVCDVRRQVASSAPPSVASTCIFAGGKIGLLPLCQVRLSAPSACPVTCSRAPEPPGSAPARAVAGCRRF